MVKVMNCRKFCNMLFSKFLETKLECIRPFLKSCCANDTSTLVKYMIVNMRSRVLVSITCDSIHQIKHATILLNIFLLDVNFNKPTIRLHFSFLSFIFAKFLSGQRSITSTSIKCLNFKFLWYKTMHKKLVYGLNNK